MPPRPTPRPSARPHPPRRSTRSDLSGGWSGADPQAAHRDGPVDEEDHARDGAHRRESDRQGPARGARRRFRTAITSPRSCATSVPRVAPPAARCSRRVPRSAVSPHVVVTADRGLCGAYNSSVIRAAEGSMKEQAELGRDYALFLVGRKAEGYFRYRNFRIDQSFTGFSDRPTYEDARKIGRAVTAAFVGRRGRHGRARLHALHQRRQPGSRPPTARPARARGRGRRRRPSRREPRRHASARPTSSSPVPTRSSTRCCRATSRPASTPRC